MSRTGQHYFELQEDAFALGLKDFVEKHGNQSADIWYAVNESVFDIEEQDEN